MLGTSVGRSVALIIVLVFLIASSAVIAEHASSDDGRELLDDQGSNVTR